MSILVGTVCFIVLLVFISQQGRDDTDAPDKGKRSGLVLYTDYGTGVQYVGTPFGALTPRLNADGSIHVVEKK